MKTASFDEVASLPDAESSSRRFVQVLAGQGHEACVNITCLNAAGVLVASGCCSSLEEGVARASNAVHDGSAMAKLQQWVGCQTDDRETSESRLSMVMDSAGIS